MKRVLRGAAFVLVLGLIFAAGYVRIPYYAVGPGPAREVDPLIDIHGHQRFAASGKLIMTTVRWYQITPLQALVAWADPDQSIVSKDLIYPPGLDQAVEQQRSLSQMDQSKIDAAYVALSTTSDYPREHGAGALIEATDGSCPAAGKLYAGDTVLSIDGTSIGSLAEASKAIEGAAPGEPLTFEVRAAGETHDIEVLKRPCAQSDRPLVGISLVESFPFPITISSGDIGGPSAGLMFALGVYDALTPGDLTGGRTIAGTGEINTRGRVRPIGGITDKVVAAEEVGASIFLVPEANMAELDGVDTGDMRLVSVATFAEAMRYLEAA